MTLTIDVSPNLERSLREEAERRGQPLPDLLRSALEAVVESSEPGTVGPVPEDANSLLELFDGAWGRISPEGRRALPVDLAEQHDHYIYGSEKRLA